MEIIEYKGKCYNMCDLADIYEYLIITQSNNRNCELIARLYQTLKSYKEKTYHVDELIAENKKLKDKYLSLKEKLSDGSYYKIAKVSKDAVCYRDAYIPVIALDLFEED